MPALLVDEHTRRGRRPGLGCVQRRFGRRLRQHGRRQIRRLWRICRRQRHHGRRRWRRSLWHRLSRRRTRAQDPLRACGQRQQQRQHGQAVDENVGRASGGRCGRLFEQGQRVATQTHELVDQCQRFLQALRARAAPQSQRAA